MDSLMQYNLCKHSQEKNFCTKKHKYRKWSEASGEAGHFLYLCFLVQKFFLDFCSLVLDFLRFFEHFRLFITRRDFFCTYGFLQNARKKLIFGLNTISQRMQGDKQEKMRNKNRKKIQD